MFYDIINILIVIFVGLSGYHFYLASKINHNGAYDAARLAIILALVAVFLLIIEGIVYLV